MALEDSTARVQPDGRLASMSQWVTRTPVIPLLTGLCFVAGTVFAYLWVDDSPFSGHGSYGISDALPMAIVCLVLGLALGFPLRRGLVRIRDAGQAGPGIVVLVTVGVVWGLAFLVQSFVFIFMEMSL